jgi:hypothetical protein
MKYWEIIADNLSKAGLELGLCLSRDREARTICIADAHRADGKRFVVRAVSECFFSIKNGRKVTGANFEKLLAAVADKFPTICRMSGPRQGAHVAVIFVFPAFFCNAGQNLPKE